MISFCALVRVGYVICFTEKKPLFVASSPPLSSFVAATAQSELLVLINFSPSNPAARASRSQHQICRRLIVFCLSENHFELILIFRYIFEL